MSIAAMTAVWKHADADGSMLLLLLALADFADDTGRSWPSVDTLRARLRLKNPRQVYRLLAEAERRGFIVREAGGGGARSNRYRLTVTPDAQVTPDLTVTPDAQVTPPLTSRTPTPGVDATPPLSSTPPETSKNRQEPSFIHQGDSADADDEPRSIDPVVLRSRLIKAGQSPERADRIVAKTIGAAR